MIMLMLELWFTGFLLEGLVFAPSRLWRLRRPIAGINILVVVASSVWLCFQLGLVAGAGFGLLAVFRVLNLLRIVKNRMHPEYLRRAVSRTSLVLLFYHVALVFALLGLYLLDSPLLAIQIGQLAAAAVILLTTVKNISKLRYRQPKTFIPDRVLPTVTVALPARNETRDLQECLRSLLSSDYPKLEIIVLDDCSQGKTAEIIKSFAQDGVRFVQGEPPVNRWLAKNQAYQQLLDESNGELVLFCGADVRVGPQAIRSMVNILLDRKKTMLSVLPVRNHSSWLDAFIQPMRYWWELALPRRLFNKPPVLSTCWLIKRETLEELGGFSAVSHAILPETYFARELVRSDAYSFIRTSGELQVATAKQFRDQYSTAVRNRYPQIRRRPEWALVITALNLIFLLGPFALGAASFWIAEVNLALSAAACAMLIMAHVAIVHTTDPANGLLALISFPIAAASELVIGYSSMFKYEFFTIHWKDRNICIPVMHVIPQKDFLANELRK